MSLIEDLPWEDVIIARILSYFSLKEVFRLRQICKDFRDIVDIYLERLQSIDLSSVKNKISVETFQSITKSRCLRELKLGGLKWLKDENILHVIEGNQLLESIDLSDGLSLSGVTIQAIAVNCKLLHTLLLKNCHWLQSPILEMLLLQCGKLTHLDLTACWELTDDTVFVICSTQKNLKWLSLAKIYGITNRSIQILQNNKIEYLDIEGCWRITNPFIRSLGANCPELKELHVNDCKAINEASLARLRVRGVKIDTKPPQRLQQAVGAMGMRINLAL
ncbi:F-box/LRR-repeat protein 15-like [Anneissia japonica]|uniref:F-box/LRR-repeat protein 15-like n=1 Tax=Anneissia japonica TaxID=1529436 RepID=UPI0014258A9A|nr:F-box/LRR-repeat protein 15-like [Anneissia japonica]XP_033122317.1 F-box/LRR-repeat protein 15-like [Anneissia japonica]